MYEPQRKEAARLNATIAELVEARDRRHRRDPRWEVLDRARFRRFWVAMRRGRP